MSMTFDDDVNGQIIGGDYLLCRLVYDGRAQGDFWASTEQEAVERAEAGLAERKKECGEAFRLIYPLDAWEVRMA